MSKSDRFKFPGPDNYKNLAILNFKTADFINLLINRKALK